jgi:ABC-type sugar transport system permease subunit
MKKIAKYDKNAVFYIAPLFLVILFIYGNSIFRVFWYSAIKWDSIIPTSIFNFPANYLEAFKDRHFIQVLSNNLIIIVLTVFLVTILALFFAQFIYLRIFGYRVYRYLFFLPVIIPNMVVGIVWTFFLHPNGPINTIFSKLGLNFLNVDWLGNIKFSLYGVIITIIWKEVGFALILFLSRLSSVDPQLYDAAKVDGANDFQTLRYITIPQLSAVIKIFIVLEVIGLLNFLFSYIWAMTRGGPGFSSTVMEYYIYALTFVFKKFGTASAMSVILFVITSILIFAYFAFSKNEEGLE